MKAQKVWFNTQAITDPLMALNGAVYGGGGGGITWYPVPGSLLSQFWTESDTQGTIRLCTFKTDLDTPMSAQFKTSLGVIYQLFATSFSAVMSEDSTILWKPQN